MWRQFKGDAARGEPIAKDDKQKRRQKTRRHGAGGLDFTEIAGIQRRLTTPVSG
jgi:hypothetical protein